MLIPHPKDIDAMIRKVRRGKMVTLTALREKLPAQAGHLEAEGHQIQKSGKLRVTF